MTEIKFPEPLSQIDFALNLERIRSIYLQDALRETLRDIKIVELDRQLSEFMSDEDLSLMASYFLRGEMLFAVPMVLDRNPYLLGYYRLLMGFSQKEFYSIPGVSGFKIMEMKGVIPPKLSDTIPDLCKAFSTTSSTLLQGIRSLSLHPQLLEDLAILTFGAQLRGGWNNKRGAEGTMQVFKIIEEIFVDRIIESTPKEIKIACTEDRFLSITFSSDPDIVIQEKITNAKKTQKLLAIEIKGGTDISNVHNRIGEAEKSHQKAINQGFEECWTIVNVHKLDREKARMESPSTARFYLLADLSRRDGAEYVDFRDRLLSITAIPDVEAIE